MKKYKHLNRQQGYTIFMMYQNDYSKAVICTSKYQVR